VVVGRELQSPKGLLPFPSHHHGPKRPSLAIKKNDEIKDGRTLIIIVVRPEE